MVLLLKGNVEADAVLRLVVNTMTVLPRAGNVVLMLFHSSFFDGPNIVFNTNFSSIIGRNMELFKKHLFRLIYAMPAVS